MYAIAEALRDAGAPVTIIAGGGVEERPGLPAKLHDPQVAVHVARYRQDARLRRFELPARGDYCPALLHAVELSHLFMRTRALLLWPQMPGYPDDKLELICPMPLRSGWSLSDGARLDVRYLTVEEPWP